MKEEEFNNFLRDKADSFEMKPSSGSFDVVARKIKSKNKRYKVVFILPVLLVLGGVAGIYLLNSNASQQNTAIAQHTSTTLPSTSATPQQHTSQNNVAPSTQVPTIINSSTHKNNSALPQTASAKGTPKSTRAQQNIDTNIPPTNTVAEPELDAPTTKETETPLLANTTQTNTATNADMPNNEIEEAPLLSAKEIAPTEKAIKRDKKTAKDSCATCACENKKWTVRAFVNPFIVGIGAEISRPYTTETSPTSTYDSYYQEIHKKGINMGLNAERSLTKRLSLGTGINYRKWAFDVREWGVENNYDSVANYKYDITINQQVFTGNSFEKVSSSLQDSGVVNVVMSSVEIPLYINYTLYNKKRFSINTRAGFAASYLFKTQYKQTFSNTASIIIASNTTNISNTSFREFNINVNGSVFAQYTIGKCWGVFAGPTISAPLLNIHSNSRYPKNHPIYWGINAGVALKF